MNKPIKISPFLAPIILFGLVIVVGTVLLHARCMSNGTISWIDAFFTATSATCVTGLAVVDTGSFFNRGGQIVIIGLMQIGGLGIMTLTSLAFFLWTRRVTLTDRIAVGHGLLHDRTFHLGKFLVRIVLWTFLIEAAGTLLIHFLDPAGFPFFSSVFHSVSAFCNAGFSLNADSLCLWRGHWGINLAFCILIFLGGIGFSVLVDLQAYAAAILESIGKKKRWPVMSWHSRVILSTSLMLVLAGWLCVYLSENVGYHGDLPFNDAVLSGLFQSVTCRTAGFNTLDIGKMTNVSLIFMMVLMFVGGGPGSCAGGIKVTTFRALVAFVFSRTKGQEQAVVGRFAVDFSSLSKAILLFTFAIIIVLLATLALNITEGGDMPHPMVRGLSLEILFEAVSAFGTVGLSMGLTAKLTFAGKCIVALLMFVGRLGPILFLSAIQSFHKELLYKRPEEHLLIG